MLLSCVPEIPEEYKEHFNFKVLTASLRNVYRRTRRGGGAAVSPPPQSVFNGADSTTKSGNLLKPRLHEQILFDKFAC